MRVRAGANWGVSTLYTGAGIVFMLFMAGLLNRDFPAGSFKLTLICRGQYHEIRS